MGNLTGKKVMVVDDEEELRELVCWELQTKGALTIEAGSGNKAFELLKTHPVDAVISDVRMPDGTGVELLEKVRALNPAIPIVVLITGHSDLSVEEAFAKGAGAYILKPFSAQALLQQLEFLLEPPATRWAPRGQRVPVNKKIELTFPTLQKAFEARAITLGRGGLFVVCDGDLPDVDTLVDFKVISQQAGEGAIEGQGLVRWVRIRNPGSNVPAGFGLEFQNLKEDSLLTIVKWVEKLSGVSYIPNA